MVYKSEPYIAATIHLVLVQAYKNFEILVIDDVSPDSSVEICLQFNDRRIKIIHQENRGVPAARNTGIRHARGEYIEGKIAVQLIHLALAIYWKLIVEELYRNLSTLVAAHLLLLPQKLYNRIGTLVVKANGTIQKRKFRQDTLNLRN